MTRDDINSLSHSKWNCKYHIVFAPKYRRMVIYRQIKMDVGRIHTKSVAGRYSKRSVKFV